MTHTPVQARDWCYYASTKGLLISVGIAIMLSLTEQVERLTDENAELRKNLARVMGVGGAP